MTVNTLQGSLNSNINVSKVSSDNMKMQFPNASNSQISELTQATRLHPAATQNVSRTDNLLKDNRSSLFNSSTRKVIFEQVTPDRVWNKTKSSLGLARMNKTDKFLKNKSGNIHVYPTKTAKKKEEMKQPVSVSGLGQQAKSTNKLKALMSKLNNEPTELDSDAVISNEAGIQQ